MKSQNQKDKYRIPFFSQHRMLKPMLMCLFCFCITMQSCNNRPKGILSDSEMEDILYDFMLAEAYKDSPEGHSLPDSVRNRLGEGILKKHGVDQQTLDSTYSWYAKNLDIYYKVHDKVNQRLAKMIAKTSGNIDKDNFVGNIWNLPQHYFFSPLGKGSVLVFELPGNVIAKGDNIEWKLHVSSPANINIKLGVDYNDSTVSFTDRSYMSERSISVNLQSDTSKVAKRIFGSIMIDKKSMPLWADSIRLTKIAFDSTTYYKFNFQKFSSGPQKRIAEKDTAETVKMSEIKDSLTQKKRKTGLMQQASSLTLRPGMSN